MEDALQGVAAVAGQVEAICHLDGVWCSLARTTGVLAGTVAADELWCLVLRQPGAHGCRGSVRQEVYNLAGDHIDHDCAVAATPAQGKVIDAQNPGRGRRRHRECPNQPDQGHTTHGDAATAREACARPTADGQANILQEAA
jgi:hypothetical protein